MDRLFGLDAERIAAELERRGVSGICEVRLRENRSRILSLSRDGRTLNAHVCLAEAPPEVIDAVAEFLTARGDAARVRARRRILAWDGWRLGLERARARRRRRGGRQQPAVAAGGSPVQVPPMPGPCCATADERARLADLYRGLNRERFGGRLPEDVPIRLSARMRSTFGHVRFRKTPEGARAVVEIALQADLMRSAGEAELLETLLHEMAHVEAWLRHGHAGHGRVWKHIAARVGCLPRACRGPVHSPAGGEASSPA